MHLRLQCPHLPEPDTRMSYRCLTDLTAADRSIFYFTALKYAHYLWLQGHAGRSILALTRALYADVPEEADILQHWPLPYAALRWVTANHQGHDYPGNPRISFQHQATRLRGDRQDLRRARAWAAWALVCSAKPKLLGDHSQGIDEPSIVEIAASLDQYGHRKERALWQATLAC